MSDVVFGPWPGSNAEDAAVRLQRERGKHTPPIPHRQPNGTLTKCLDCEMPFHTRRPVPTDQLCRDCRAARKAAEPLSLFEVDS